MGALETLFTTKNTIDSQRTQIQYLVNKIFCELCENLCVLCGKKIIHLKLHF